MNVLSVSKHYKRLHNYICDTIGQNRSHVAKHKWAEICILSENIKMCPFIVFIKAKCDLMGQNQSHVTIFSYGVKYTSF